MKYFTASDIHGFYDEYIASLKEAGFQENNKEHKLIICGDLFDRGNQPIKLFEYLSKLPKEKYIYIKGNHEDLFMDCLHQIIKKQTISSHHITNKTLKTICDICNMSEYDIFTKTYSIERVKNSTKPYVDLIESSVNYFETDNYIFVHGWIPLSCKEDAGYIPLDYIDGKFLQYNPSWRHANNTQWEEARWMSCLKAYKYKLFEPNKSIVCGHWHCSALWAYEYPDKYGEFDGKDNLKPFIKDGIIAIDACTAYSRRVNVIVLTDTIGGF